MSIRISQDGKNFLIETANTTYASGVSPSGYLNHYYYGKKIAGADPADFRHTEDEFSGISFCPYRKLEHITDSRNLALQECTTHNVGDYRISSVIVRDALGCDSTDPQFVSAKTFPGRYEWAGSMPRVRVNDDASVETLEVLLRDPATGVEYVLDYIVFPAQDCIVRSMEIRNNTENAVDITRAMSFTLDIEHSDLDLIHCHGSYARERFGYSRAPLQPGTQGFFSTRTSSGHDQNPAFALAERSATEEQGGVFGCVLLYSGSFSVEIEQEPYFRTRATAGIHPETFQWHLESGESFRTPEAILTFSANGIGGMSHNFHEMLREHLISPRWVHEKRPILVNNWEGTGMDFNREKLLNIASVAAKCGVEMFVLDDGWFGHRDNDRSSLGDWFVYEEKVGSLKTLAEDINRMGLKFGLWFEPEMISEDSELYKAHPEWLFSAPNRARTYGRHQCVLNMGLPEVVDYLFEKISAILRSAPIVYMKWDFNRQPAEISSPILPPDRQGEAGHRFVLGMYELHRRLLEAFPELLIEGCSGGGGRFDAGMLYYVPQIWTSDNTDALDRMYIQANTSLFYPCSCQGAHVTRCHPAKRNMSWETRGAIALAGTFGYELDMTQCTEEEQQIFRDQIAMYHRYHHLVNDGILFRLNNLWDGENRFCTWEFAAKDQSEMLMIHVTARQIPHPGRKFIRFRGLDPQKKYQLDGTDTVLSGSYLMDAGLPIPQAWGDNDVILWHFTAV